MRSLGLIVLVSAGAACACAVEELGWQDAGPWRLTERAAPSPKRQLAFARSVEESGNFAKAQREYELLLRQYRDAPEAGTAAVGAARSVFLAGRTSESLEKLWQALRRYPEGARASDGVELGCAIGKMLLDQGLGAKPKVNRALLEQSAEVFRKVLMLDPMGEAADDAAHFLGLACEGTGRIDEAVKSYSRLLASFPESPHRADARARLGISRMKASPGGVETDPGALHEARMEITSAAGELGPGEASASGAGFGAELAEVDERAAEKKFRRGVFYQSIGKAKPPGSTWAWWSEGTPERSGRSWRRGPSSG